MTRSDDSQFLTHRAGRDPGGPGSVDGVRSPPMRNLGDRDRWRGVPVRREHGYGTSSRGRAGRWPAPRFGRFQKVTTLLPLALLSAAVTASLAGVGATSARRGERAGRPRSPTAPPSLPTRSRLPASVSARRTPPPAVSTAGSTARSPTASTSGIPAAALSAYQRAETVINAADKSCNLSWQLVAAIGRVESDHGRFNGNTLDNDGPRHAGHLRHRPRRHERHRR